MRKKTQNSTKPRVLWNGNTTDKPVTRQEGKRGDKLPISRNEKGDVTMDL